MFFISIFKNMLENNHLLENRLKVSDLSEFFEGDLREDLSVTVSPETDFKDVAPAIAMIYASGRFRNSYFPPPRFITSCKSNILTNHDLLLLTDRSDRTREILNYINYIFDTLGGSSGNHLNLNAGEIKYHPKAISHTPTRKHNPTVTDHFNIVTARSNLRHLCEKASIVLLACLILETTNSDVKLLQHGINYACGMRSLENNEASKNLRYLLELATVYNTFFEKPVEFKCIARHYMYDTPTRFRELHAFGDYFSKVLTPENENEKDFYSHLVTNFKVKDDSINIYDNCVFYLPYVTPVRDTASNYVDDTISVLMLSEELNVWNVFYQLSYIVSYEDSFICDPENTNQSTTPTPRFADMTEATEYVNSNIIIPDSFGPLMKKYFKSIFPEEDETFNLYAVLSIAGVIQNVFVKRFNTE
jgi:hypothetical protein